MNIPAPPAPIANNFDLIPTATAAPVSVCMGGSETVEVACVVGCVVVVVVEWNEVRCVVEEIVELLVTVSGREGAGTVVKTLLVKVLVLQLQEVDGRVVAAETLVLGACVTVTITTVVAVAVECVLGALSYNGSWMAREALWMEQHLLMESQVVVLVALGKEVKVGAV